MKLWLKYQEVCNLTTDICFIANVFYRTYNSQPVTVETQIHFRIKTLSSSLNYVKEPESRQFFTIFTTLKTMALTVSKIVHISAKAAFGLSPPLNR